MAKKRNRKKKKKKGRTRKKTGEQYEMLQNTKDKEFERIAKEFLAGYSGLD